MGKIKEKTLMRGRIDGLGRLLLTPSQMKALNFNDGETVSLDFNDEGIIIAKSLGYSIVYDRVKVMPNGILIGRDICQSKLLMTEDRKITEKIKTKVFDKNNNYLQEDIIPATNYNIDYHIDNHRIIIPLTDEQQQAEMHIIRTVDEFDRILIPKYLRVLHNLKMEIGIEIRGSNIFISNNIERKTIIDKLGRVNIPKDILEALEITPKMELEINTSDCIILRKLK